MSDFWEGTITAAANAELVRHFAEEIQDLVIHDLRHAVTEFGGLIDKHNPRNSRGDASFAYGCNATHDGG